MASILISTWGDYRKWHEVIYKMDGNIYQTKVKSSMPAIVSYAYPKIEKVFIIVLDTIVKKRVSSYVELRENVTKYYQDFLNSMNLDVESEIIVAPGVGKKFKLDDGGFSDFQGFLTDFQVYIIFEIVRRILDLNEDEITVHLDLTHGVNFMPSLTYAAINEILEVLAVAKEISLKVYNADPFISPEVTDELTIHTVENRRIRPHIKNEALPQKSELLGSGIYLKKDQNEIKSICSSTALNEKDINELNAFLSSIVNGFPLVYYTFYPEVDFLEHNLINKAMDLWFSQIKVYHLKKDTLSFSKEEGGEKIPERSIIEKMIVERKLRFRREFTRLIIIWALAKALNEKRRNDIKISEIKSLQRRIFYKWPKIDSMIRCELEDIENAIRKSEYTSSEWTKLINLSKENRTPTKGRKMIRHFLAHSGFEWTLTYVKRVDNEIYLSYNIKNQEDLEKIFEACLKGLQ